MNTSIFTIRGNHQAFFNLETAIHAAKDIVKSSVVNDVKIYKASSEKFHDSREKAYSNENLRRCPLKYTVVKGNNDNEIRVRARLNIPIPNSSSNRKHITVSRSVIIETNQMSKSKKDIEYIFDFKESEVISCD